GCDRSTPVPAAEQEPPATTAPAEASPHTPEAIVEDDGEGEPESLPDGVAPTPPEYDPAPWSAAPLAAADVPAVYLQQWRKADNRVTCAVLAPATDIGDAKPRAA